MAATMLIGLTTAAGAAEPPASIRDIVEACASCHGQNAISEVEGTPSIAGQPDIFTQYQLVFMRDGGRDAGVMKEAVKGLTDDNIRDLGAYYASLKPPPAQKGPAGVDPQKVNALIRPRHCDSCHKPDFSGQGETARLAGQRPDYLMKALSDFRSGVRRGRGMATMMEVSVTLKDQDIRMLATYLAHKP